VWRWIGGTWVGGIVRGWGFVLVLVVLCAK